MANRIINVGIAGQGRSGFDIHAAWLRQAPDKFRIVAVADQLPQRRQQAQKDFACRAYKTYQELARDEQVELFVNALPSLLHPKGATEALKAGKHVLCEKPLAVQADDVDKMIAAAKKSRRVLAPFQNSRFYPFFVKAREIIASGVIGRVVHIRLNWSGFGRRWDWQTLQQFWGGNLNNTGPHPMDHAVTLYGEGAPKVFCRMASEANSYGDADDFCLTTLYGKGHPVVEVMISSYQAYSQGDQINVCGTRGGIAGNSQGLKWKYFDPAKAPRQKLRATWSDNRQYCSEQLPWVEESWTPPASELNAFFQLSKGFYDNIYDVLARGGELAVTPQQVRRQIAVIEECHRQNPLPKLARKRATMKG